MPQAESVTLSKYYDERAAAFGKTVQSCQYRSVKSFAQRQRVVLDGLKGIRGKRILDLGCGPGLFTSPLAKENEIVGIDLSLEMLRLARPDLKPVKGDGTSLPFQNGSFDLILAIEMLQHLADFRPLLEEILRVLRPGGEFIISSLNPTSVFHRALWSFGGYRGLFFHSDKKVGSFFKKKGFTFETRFLSFPFPWIWKGEPNKRWKNFLATSWVIQCRLK